MTARLRNNGLIALIGLLVALAILTLIPGNSTKPNDLGYFSTCSFVPWSTLTLLLAAFVLWIIRRYFQTRPQLQRLD